VAQMKITELRDEIAARSKDGAKIRERVDEYVRYEYGVQGFTTLAEGFFAGQRKFGVCLARQIPTANLEHLAKERLVEWMMLQNFEVEAIPMALTRDSVGTKNPLKISYWKVPILDRGRNGRINVQNLRVLEVSDSKDIGQRILSEIRTTSGQTLVEYHQNLRQGAGVSRWTVDLSYFFLECLRQSIQAGSDRAPKQLYVVRGSKEKKIWTREADLKDINRPPADWYYFLYLMLFLDGKRGLLSTVDDDDIVTTWFKQSIRKIEEVVGVKPLILDTPKGVEIEGYVSNLVEVPKWPQKDKSWRHKLGMPPADAPIFNVCEHFEKALIQNTPKKVA